eukprot:3296140-Prymnesium_polylepis.1
MSAPPPRAPMGACGRTHVSRDSCTHKPMTNADPGARALRRWCQMLKGREGKLRGRAQPDGE